MTCKVCSVRAGTAQNGLGVAPAELKRRQVFSPSTGGASYLFLEFKS